MQSSPGNSKKLGNGNSPKKDDDIWDHRTPVISRLNSLECWDYTIELECLSGTQDLQLAAELGKTLLERNKELESALKKHQHLIEDQAQEIEYLTKQVIALREVNDSRLRIYESLENSIQDLEHEKHRLLVENNTDKKHIRNLCHSIETLETRCEDFGKQVEDLTRCLDMERRRNERLNETLIDPGNHRLLKLRKTSVIVDEGNASESESEQMKTSINSRAIDDRHTLEFMDNKNSASTNSQDTTDSGFNNSNKDIGIAHVDNDEVIQLIGTLEEAKRQYAIEHVRVAELEEQISVIAQENQTLSTRLAQVHTMDEMKSVHEELSILEEVRQGQMCSRCLRGLDDRMIPTENTSLIGTEDDDDRSLIDLLNCTECTESEKIPPIYRSSVTIKIPTADKPTSLNLVTSTPINPYRELVEKYEALLEVQRSTTYSRQRPASQMTLHDELLQITQSKSINSGDFNSFNTKYTSDDENHKVTKAINGNTGARHKTPIDFSEVETSSSGFSDETSHKHTQTDERPGAFLCTIADGEDCKFTIYDDASPIDSRFRDRPKYRDLFREIFTVLKKAAENKDEGEQLPLLDDQQPALVQVKVPPVTPAAEEQPYDFDSQSVISSVISENSIAVSECVTKTERRKAKQHKKQAAKDENQPPIGVHMTKDGKLVTPYNRQPLEYNTLTASTKKRARRSRQCSKDKYGRDNSLVSNSNCSSVTSLDQRPDSPTTPTPSRSNKKGRKHHQKMLEAFSTAGNSVWNEWNGSSLTVYNRNTTLPGPSYNVQMDNTSEIEFRPSTASQNLNKLKKLELSYAEVLRKGSRQKRWKN